MNRAGLRRARDPGGLAHRSVTREAVADAAPVVLGYVPFGLTVGAALATTGVPAGIAWSSSPLLFGGAAQLVAVRLLGAGASAAVAVVAALVVNSRLLLYSAGLARHAADWPARWRWVGAYLLIDPLYALAARRFDGPDGGGSARDRLRYYLTLGAMFWPSWMVLTGAGVLLSGVLPAGLRLDLAVPLTFLLLLLPMLDSRAARAAAAAGGVVAFAASELPWGLGLLAGAAAGIAAGGLVAGGLVGARHD